MIYINKLFEILGFPHEIALGEDLADWNKMTDDEKHALSFNGIF